MELCPSPYLSSLKSCVPSWGKEVSIRMGALGPHVHCRFVRACICARQNGSSPGICLVRNSFARDSTFYPSVNRAVPTYSGCRTLALSEDSTNLLSGVKLLRDQRVSASGIVLGWGAIVKTKISQPHKS